MNRPAFFHSSIRFLLVAALALVSLALVAPAQAERRAAIVVGNGEYEFAPLPNPRNDAKLIAATLAELDFDVLLFYDITKATVGELKEAVAAHLVGADMAILCYAGHAVQYRGQNLLLPVDVRTGSARQVFEDAIALDQIIEIVNEDGNGIKLIILDACRNSPLAEEEGLAAGLANTEAGSGEVLIAFSTAAGEVAYDGTGINSPYSSALANALQKADFDVYDVFREVRGTVRMATAGSQIPWISGSIETQFVFRPGDGGEARPVAPVSAPEGRLGIDEVLWFFISESRDPNDFTRFARVFPDSRHHAEAVRRSRTVIARAAGRGVFLAGDLVPAEIASEPPAEAPIQAASKEFVFQQAGERAVSETFRIWPHELPETDRGMRTMVTECDLYAADPNDPQRAVPGVTNGMVNIRDGLRACAFALAADTANPRLQYQLGRVLEIAGRYDWAENFYELAGEQQYSAALVNLGFMARTGKGREVDERRALELYLRAAALGNLRARTNVGTAFIRGQGVPAKPEEGILWYRLAASSGWANAITALGDAHARGVGVEKDPVEAARLYAAAADAGQIDALSNLGRAYVGGSGVEKDAGKGLDLLLEATAMGNQYAPFHAAKLFIEGEGSIAADPARALELFELSARRGFENAYLELARGYRNGSLASGKPNMRLAYYNAALAARLDVEGAAELRDELGGKLGADTRKTLDGEVELFIQQNGE